MSLFFINQTYLTLARNKSFYHNKFKPGCRIGRTDSKMSNITTLMCTFWAEGGGGVGKR